MDDRKLELLVAAAEEGSINKAAARCHCTQSAAAQAVNAAEADLGCKVFDRTHSGVSLNDAGKLLFPLMLEAREALARLKRAAVGVAQRGNHVVIGSYPSVVQAWLPGALSAYGRVEPSATFDIRIGSSELAKLLVDGDVDLIICDDWLFEEAFSGPVGADYRVAGKGSGHAMVWVPLATDPFRAIVPASAGIGTGGVVTRSELFEKPYIFDAKYVFARYLSSEVSEIVKVSVDDNASILSMVASGMGVTVLPELSLRSVPEGVAVLDLDPPGQRTVGIAISPDATKAASVFARFLGDYMAR